MKNRLTGLFSLILCSLILTGCSIFSEYDYEKESQKNWAAMDAAEAAGEVYDSGYWEEPSIERFWESLETWKGAHISELVVSWGKPDFIEEGGLSYLGEKTYTYTYVRNTERSSGSSYDNPGQSSLLRCELTVLVKLDGSISVIREGSMYDCGKMDPSPPRDNPGQRGRERIHTCINNPRCHEFEPFEYEPFDDDTIL